MAGADPDRVRTRRLPPRSQNPRAVDGARALLTAIGVCGRYADGFKGGVLMLNGYIQALAYAAEMESGKIEACEFYCDGHGGPPGGDRGLYWRCKQHHISSPFRLPCSLVAVVRAVCLVDYAHFAYLALNVEEMFVTGKATYPVERCAATTTPC